jgi:zinc transporter 9
MGSARRVFSHRPSLPALSALAPTNEKSERQTVPTAIISPVLLAQRSLSYAEQKRWHTIVTMANQTIAKAQQRQFSRTSRETTEGPSGLLTTPPEKIIQEEKARRIPIRVPNTVGARADEAVQVLQQARKDKARKKTAKNVQRALIGNVIICAAKLGAWITSGSSSMMSEFIHSVVDCGNQSLLLMGLRDSQNEADRLHPYGYGKSVYFWALVSALGTFFLGAGVSMSHAIPEVLNPSLQVISVEVWSVLALSFGIDGYVLYKTVQEINEEKPNNIPFWQHAMTLRDPATLAVLLEDGAACLGIVIAIAGISASHATGMPIFDGLAGVGISVLLGTMGLALVRVNHRFLIGRGVSRDMTDDIEKIIRSRRSIDGVYRIQSQWTGPETFSFKAEVDFDGTYLAAELMPRYKGEFDVAKENYDQELQVLLSWYAEDVIRAVEREVRHIEALIRHKYPGAEYIELEPMSKDADKFAIDDSLVDKLLQSEKEEIKRITNLLHPKQESQDESQGKSKQV